MSSEVCLSTEHCLPENVLREYVAGEVNTERCEIVESHIEMCGRCSELVQRLESEGDSLAHVLRRCGEAQPSEFLSEAGFVGVILNLNQLVPRLPLSPDPGSSDPSPPDDHSETSPQALRRNQTLGSYRLLRQVGRGGMGDVFLALNLPLNKFVAVKSLSAARLHEPKMRGRFLREMKAVGRINHSHVVQALDAEEISGVPLLIMEFVDGMDLSALIRKCGRLSVPNACELVRQAATGLAEIHRHGMVHRDVKPGNLMLSREGIVKILDLGLAMLSPHSRPMSGELTSTHQVMGTIDYMSPEQADSNSPVDHRADLYGLGATLFTLLTGEPPYGGKNNSLLHKLARLATEPTRPIRSLRADVPDDLSAIVTRLLHRSPDKRYASAPEVMEALVPYCRDSCLAELTEQIVPQELADVNAGVRGTLERNPDNTAETQTAVVKSKPMPAAADPVTEGMTSPNLTSEPGKRGRAPRWTVALSVVACLVSVAVWLQSQNRNARHSAVTPVAAATAEVARSNVSTNKFHLQAIPNPKRLVNRPP